MNHQNTKKLTTTALFMALTCVATMIIKIPTIGTGGYIHLGDTFVVLSGILLGPVYGALAAGIGSALADLLGGYLLYVPITFFVKAVIGAGVGLIYHKFTKHIYSRPVKCIFCGMYSTLMVAFGYLFFEYLIYKNAAFASFPANVVQGLSGFVISSALLPILQKIHITD